MVSRYIWFTKPRYPKTRGLPSEVEPTQLGSNVVFKINKNWKIKTGMQYQYNAIRKRWEWIPQVSVSYEW